MFFTKTMNGQKLNKIKVDFDSDRTWFFFMHTNAGGSPALLVLFILADEEICEKD